MPHEESDNKRTKAQERFDRIYLDLRDRICLLEYEPNTRLSEDELAELYGVSRTPIRRVLSRLEAEGLVESQHGVGTFVTHADFGSLTEVYKLRMELAELVGRLDPVPRTTRDLDRLRRLLAHCDDLINVPNAKAFAKLNMAVFEEISAVIGNQPLREISDRLYFMTTRIWLTTVPDESLSDEIATFRREIADLLSALEIGDLESVGHLLRSHISMAFTRLKAYALALRDHDNPLISN